MAIVPLLGPDDVDEDYRVLLERPINLFAALINAPDGFARFHALAEWIRWDASLDPRLRELAILYVGYLSRDAYEWSHHLRLSEQFGVTDDDIRGLIDHAEGRPSVLGPRESLVLAATRQLTLTNALDDDLTARLTAEFSDRQLTELVIVIAFYAMVVRVLGGLRIEVEPDYLVDLARFPLPTAPHTWPATEARP